MAVGTGLLLVTISLYGLVVASKGEIKFGNTLPFAITLLVIFFMVFFIRRNYWEVSRGMPLEDERSKKVMTQAAAMAFYISLYWLLALSLFESFFAGMFGVEHLDASQTTGGGIAGMAIAWIVCWLYYDKKGKLL